MPVRKRSRGSLLTSYFEDGKSKRKDAEEDDEKLSHAKGKGKAKAKAKAKAASSPAKKVPSPRKKVRATKSHTALAASGGGGGGAGGAAGAVEAEEPEEEEVAVATGEEVEAGEEDRSLVTVKGVTLPADWMKHLKWDIELPYFKKLASFVKAERKSKEIFPPPEDVFSAFLLTPLSSVKVVILGQDPYHDNNQAHGLAFSVRKGIKIPPSLRNMLKETASDVGTGAAPHGCLECWANQGVFLLNTVLTVQAHKANSHRKKGWEKFTDAVINTINKKQKNVVFMLWGKPSQKKAKNIDRSKHLVLECPHPSPLSASRGFFGCKHFSKANEYLKQHNKEPIDWSIPA